MTPLYFVNLWNIVTYPTLHLVKADCSGGRHGHIYPWRHLVISFATANRIETFTRHGRNEYE